MPKTGSFGILCLLVISVLFTSTCKAQTKENLGPYYNWFDTAIGIENQEIHYGAVYSEKHRAKSKKSKFFPSPYFTKGDVVIDNLPYYSLELKYNVYEDELLMQVANNLGGKILQLHKDKISSFTIAGHWFTKIDGVEAQKTHISSGFYEVILEKPSFTLLKKHRRLLTEQLGADLIFYEFEELDSEFIVRYTDSYHRLKKMQDVKVLFPQNVPELNDYLKNLPSNLSFEDRLKSVFSFMDTLLNETKDKTMNK
ncbi:hypothetical protein [Ulvibacterium sp.]|uniref:hypothetical protein n=1 Tax=Ulvibacterium sp. TaxID=2665914 RepID=UPI0026358968|nr:hypothetical protein [Ulvibacterium sp.]